MEGILDQSNPMEYDEGERKYTTASGCGVWQNDEIDQLIDLFEEKIFLWDIKHKDYHTKSKRAAAIREIASMLGKSTGDVLKKWQNLRSYFSREYLKLRKSKSEAVEGDDIRGSKWVYYERLVFLKEQIVPRTRPIPSSESSDGEDCDDNEDSEEDSKANVFVKESKRRRGSDSGANLRPTKRVAPGIHCNNRRSTGNINVVAPPPVSVVPMTLPSSSTQNAPPNLPKPRKDEDANDVYGRHIANELRRIPDTRAKELAKVKIQNILYEANYGQTTETPFISSSAIPQTLAAFAHYLMTMQNSPQPPLNTHTVHDKMMHNLSAESPNPHDSSIDSIANQKGNEVINSMQSNVDDHQNSGGDISTTTGQSSY